MEATMFERIKALKQRWHDLKEIENISDTELDDLGMSRDQIEAFVRMPHDVPDRVAAMAAIFGLTEEQIKEHHEEYLDLLYTCGQCRDRKACRHLLDMGTAARPQDASFCLNRQNFADKATTSPAGALA
jgi:uncharacterized protein YjiS (DUF1127 family)